MRKIKRRIPKPYYETRKIKRRLPNPYYETKLGKLYHGDCLDIMPYLPKVDLIVTDPPYRIDAKSGGGLYKKNDWLKNISKEKIDEFNPDKFLNLIKPFHGYIFCSKYLINEYISFFKKEKYKWEILIYTKRSCVPTKNNKYLPDKEYCFFVRGIKECYFNNHNEFKKYKTVKFVKKTSNKYHPAEKDLDFIKDIISISSKKNQIIFDPYLGSGTTAVACEHLDRRWIGIEEKEKYCKISVQRIEEQTKMPLFDKPEQTESKLW